CCALAEAPRACAAAASSRVLYWGWDCWTSWAELLACSFLSLQRARHFGFGGCGFFRFDLVLVLFERKLFGVAIHRVALHQNREVDAVRVKFRPVNAGEFTLAFYQHAATAAHSGAVDHDRVQADH